MFVVYYCYLSGPQRYLAFASFSGENLVVVHQARSPNNSRFLVSFGVCGVWLLVLSFIVKASLCGFCRGPLLDHRVPPVIAERRGCSSSPNLPSPALPRVGTTAGGMTCRVAEEHRRAIHHHAKRNRPQRTSAKV